jgi:general L-amino acid transport system substrate-binding protein
MHQRQFRLPRPIMLAFIGGAVVLIAVAAASPASAQATLQSIKQRGTLICGVDPGDPGMAYRDAQGQYKGLDIDYCRAVAAAIFGDASKVKYEPMTAQARFAALSAGEIDVLIRDSGLVFSRDNSMGLDGAATNFYAGQGFIVKKSSGIQHAKDLNGGTLCTVQGSTIELNTAEFARANNITIKVLGFQTLDESLKAFIAGRCDTYSDDNGSIAGVRSTMTNPDDYVILPEVISREPNTSFVRKGDENFEHIVKWVHYAMVDAEDLGVSSKNVDQMRKSSTNDEIQRLLGVQGDLGAQLGLGNDWAYNIIKQVGNYGESYDANVGEGSPLKLPRGENALWRNGGLQYSPQFR